MRHKLLTTALTLLLLFSILSTVSAEERVTLHFAHVGADSTNFSTESDCGGVNAGVVWHLVLNQLDPGTETQTLHAVFQNAGHLEVVGRSVGNGSLQHFYVGTPDDDILLEAYVDVTGQSRTPKLLLSHVCHKDQKDEEKKDDDKEKEKDDDKKKEKDVPPEDLKVDPDDKKDIPKDRVIDEERELPQTAGTCSKLIPFSIILAAGGLLLKTRKY